MSKEQEKIKIVPNRIEEQLEKVISENKRLRIQYASATKQVNELNEFMQIMLNMLGSPSFQVFSQRIPTRLVIRDSTAFAANGILQPYKGGD